MHWLKALLHQTGASPERSLRRLERQIATYKTRQSKLEAKIQRLCAQHLALQLALRRQQSLASKGQPSRAGSLDWKAVISPGGQPASRT